MCKKSLHEPIERAVIRFTGFRVCLLRQRQTQADAVVGIGGRIGSARNEWPVDLQIIEGTYYNGFAEGVIGGKLHIT